MLDTNFRNKIDPILPDTYNPEETVLDYEEEESVDDFNFSKYVPPKQSLQMDEFLTESISFQTQERDSEEEIPIPIREVPWKPPLNEQVSLQTDQPQGLQDKTKDNVPSDRRRHTLITKAMDKDFVVGRPKTSSSPKRVRQVPQKEKQADSAYSGPSAKQFMMVMNMVQEQQTRLKSLTLQVKDFRQANSGEKVDKS